MCVDGILVVKSGYKEGGLVSGSMCENCCYYTYDEDYDCYVCEMDLDEDETERFLKSALDDCHYYQPYDEYAVVKKQN